MSEVVHAREHGRALIGQNGLTDSELEFLVRLRDRSVGFFTEERVQGQWHCRFGGYAGAISMPGGRTLELLPKVGKLDDPATRVLLMRMLSAANVAPSIEEVGADYGDSPTIIEAYLRFAADLALQQVRLGLIHAYKRIDRTTPMVKGRLLVASQLAKMPERFDFHIVRADEFLADTPVNRIIKAGIRWISRATRVNSTAAKCREIVMRMDAVTDAAGPARALGEEVQRLARDGIGRDRRHARLAPLLKVLVLLLDGMAVAPQAGLEAPGPTLIFDMSRVFEALVAARLRWNLPDCGVDEQARHAFDLDGRFTLRPDLVVRRNSQPVLVLDAKWKRITGAGDITDADLRQAYTYARVLGVQNAVLVYPRLADDAPPLREIRIADGSGVQIYLWHVSVMTQGWAGLDEDLARLGMKVGLLPTRSGR